jgi:hypothetical protein
MPVLSEFRFRSHADMVLLAQELGLPEVMLTETSIPFTGVEGLCVVCNFLAYPVRYRSMERIFGRGASAIRSINSTVMRFLIEKYRTLIQSIDFARITPDLLQTFADAVDAKGAMLKGVWGFVDGAHLLASVRAGWVRACGGWR